MNFTAAFQCGKCPQNGNPELGPACPCWWETIQSSTTGEERIWKACAWQQLPYYLVQVIQASNRPAAAIESTRNEIAKGFGRIGELLSVQITDLLPNTRPEREFPGRFETLVPGRGKELPDYSGSDE